MARKRKTKTRKSSRSRSRSRSMIGAIDFNSVVGVVVGAVATKLLDKVIPDTINDKIVSGGKVALGLALPMLSKEGKTKNLLSGVGNGMIAVGVVELLNSFGVLNGLGANDDEMLVVSLDGADDLNVVNGMDDINVVNGLGDDVLGDDVLANMEMSGDDDDDDNEFN